MRTFPIFIDLDASRVVVVGSGEQAVQKIRLLQKTPAKIEVISKTLTGELKELARYGRIVWRRDFAPATLDGCRLVFAAGDPETNVAVARAACERNIPVNVVDDPALCTFQTPAIVDRAPVVVAIGTEGTSPVLARQIRAELEGWLPQRLGRLAILAGALRSKVKAHLRSDPRARRRFWGRFLAGRVRALVFDGREAEARAAAEALLDDGSLNPGGHVSLVGAGPGTADLLTLRALRRLQEADVIVHDRLIDSTVLDCARRDARRIDVGKMPGQACIAQADINAVLIAEAKAGNDVVRLKGGDPMIFGRIGEEMAALEAAGISYDIVPGVTSATACAAEARMLLTHREEVRSIVLLTGHSTAGVTPYDWAALAKPGTAFAFYMAVGAAPRIQANLLAVGMPADTPVTIVEKGCSPAARTVRATLASMARVLQENRISNPAMLFVRYATPSADRTGKGENVGSTACMLNTAERSEQRALR